jgi:hypothetical protein
MEAGTPKTVPVMIVQAFVIIILMVGVVIAHVVMKPFRHNFHQPSA